MKTVTLPAGIVTLPAIASDTLYQGAGKGKTIVSNTSSAAFAHTLSINALSDVRFDGITFTGNGVALYNCTDVTFTNCEVTMCKRTANDHQGFIVTNCNGVTLDHFDFSDNVWAFNAVGVNTRLTLTNITCQRNNINIKGQFGDGTDTVLVDGLLCQQSGYYPVEFQGDGRVNKVTVRNVAYFNPALSTNDNQNKLSGGPSLPMMRVTNLLCELIYVDGTTKLTDGSTRVSTPAWLGVRWGVEIGGGRDLVAPYASAPIIRNCMFLNLNDPVAVTSSRAVKCYDNLIKNCLEKAGFASPANGISDAMQGSNFYNNGTTASVPAFSKFITDSVGLIPSTPVDPLPVVTPPPDQSAQIAALQIQIDMLQQKISNAKLALN